MSSPSRIGSALMRFSVIATGPIATAGANFALALMLIPNSNANEFGFFSFAMVVINLGIGVSNALCATPLSIAWNNHNIAKAELFVQLRSVNLILAVACSVVVATAGLCFSLDMLSWLPISMAAGIAITRWYRRSLEYARLSPSSALASDARYSLTAISLLALLHCLDAVSLATAGMLMILSFAATFIGLPVAIDLSKHRKYSLTGYANTWKSQTKWSSIGVLCTELSTNAHSYVIPVLAGPSAYAAISVAMLWWRPSQTLFTALVLSERPKIAKAIGGNLTDEAHRATRMFTIQCLAIVCANGAGIAAAFLIFPRYFIVDGLNSSLVAIMLASFSSVIILKALRTPTSVLCQAKNLFRPLAAASFITAPISVLSVVIALLLVGPHGAVMGVAAGELVYYLVIRRIANGAQK